MTVLVPRSRDARDKRKPDVFLSHSSRDKSFVKRLAEDLCFLEVDVWLDAWELQVGDSLYDVITDAMEKSEYIGVILGDNYADSRWARDELKQALARERREEQVTIIPMLCGAAEIPPFLEDKLYLDFRSDYFAALSRLAAMVHEVSRKRIEVAIDCIHPGPGGHSFSEVLRTVCENE